MGTQTNVAGLAPFTPIWWNTAVLWHPAGVPMKIGAVRNGNRYYAKDSRGRWWLLSRKGSKGYRIPVLQIKKRDPSATAISRARAGGGR